MNCNYHPTEIAVDKCEDCHIPICLECKRVYNEYHMGSKYSRGYVEKVTLCPVCNCARIQNKVGVDTLCLVIFGSALIIISALNLEKLPYYFILLILGLGVVGKGIYNILGSTKEKAQAKNECDAFLQSIQKNNPKNQADNAQYRKGGYLSCHQCGNKMEITSKFCSKCGDPTHDEWHVSK